MQPQPQKNARTEWLFVFDRGRSISSWISFCYLIRHIDAIQDRNKPQVQSTPPHGDYYPSETRRSRRAASRSVPSHSELAFAIMAGYYVHRYYPVKCVIRLLKYYCLCVCAPVDIRLCRMDHCYMVNWFLDHQALFQSLMTAPNDSTVADRVGHRGMSYSKLRRSYGLTMSADMIRWVGVFCRYYGDVYDQSHASVPSTRDSKKCGLREVSFPAARLESIAYVFPRWRIGRAVSGDIWISASSTWLLAGLASTGYDPDVLRC
ncbi:uncharacterized protein APUU_70543S [Aspergillus puulaauensis]|uniref:Uncharacterized protein n=1 Tax=Aspergillus puulaauensis TaxID=1220207 RepID=A0A7R8ATI6_9EURO|nr:uncharacterized protein APUU_70543S [Aspergillus puulaauensis]BCS28973.1 hypothetical protein APUU_70543S [Aspergillus puulaauensis]